MLSDGTRGLSDLMMVNEAKAKARMSAAPPLPRATWHGLLTTVSKVSTSTNQFKSKTNGRCMRF